MINDPFTAAEQAIFLSRIEQISVKVGEQSGDGDMVEMVLEDIAELKLRLGSGRKLWFDFFRQLFKKYYLNPTLSGQLKTLLSLELGWFWRRLSAEERNALSKGNSAHYFPNSRKREVRELQRQIINFFQMKVELLEVGTFSLDINYSEESVHEFIFPKVSPTAILQLKIEQQGISVVKLTPLATAKVNQIKDCLIESILPALYK